MLRGSGLYSIRSMKLQSAEADLEDTNEVTSNLNHTA
jgi:hypothetical protein